VRDLLSNAMHRLREAHVDAPRLVAEALLAHTLDWTREQLLAHGEHELTRVQQSYYDSLVRRCERGEPFAYVLGRREFYGLDLIVDTRVLIPRPETELVVETALALARGAEPGYRIVDVGSGSGAIAIALAVHLPQAQIIATDISRDAIAVATANAQRHSVSDRVQFIGGDLLAPLDQPVDLIAANLPYVTSSEWSNLSYSIRSFEPSLAFRGGSDGLRLIERLLHDAPRVLKPRGAIVLEIGAEQGAAAGQMARDVFANAHVEVRQDYAGLDRVMIVRP
jgi:release factor glutamine methyltransferase